MKLKALTPNLMADDVAATVAWYQSVLGFEKTAEVPGDGEPLQFAIMHRDDVQLMFQSRKSLVADLPDLANAPAAGAGTRPVGTFYIEIEGIEEMRREVDGKLQLLKDLHETFYGTKEFYFKDCNGYILSFAETMS